MYRSPHRPRVPAPFAMPRCRHGPRWLPRRKTWNRTNRLPCLSSPKSRRTESIVLSAKRKRPSLAAFFFADDIRSAASGNRLLIRLRTGRFVLQLLELLIHQVRLHASHFDPAGIVHDPHFGVVADGSHIHHAPAGGVVHLAVLVDAADDIARLDRKHAA